MTAQDKEPGAATLEELTAYWRMPSLRSARELAQRLGLRCVRGKYPWFAIWRLEGLAPPAARLWPELKLPHLTTSDVADLLQESRRAAQRKDQRKPDASFPERLRFRSKPKLWRQAQINAWAAGLPVPVYTLLPDQPRRPPMLAKTAASERSTEPSSVFDPYCEIQFSDA